MLCSRCNEIIKPVVVFDIDGVLGDYHGHFHDFAEGYLGVKLTESAYDGTEPHREWYRHQGVTVEEFRTMKLAFRQGSMKRTMPPYRRVIQIVQKCRAKGAELWLCTQRPYMSLDNIDRDTRAWLDRHGVPFDYMLYHEEKYAQLEKRVDKERVVAIVDDTAEMYDHAEDIFGEAVPILYKGIYNRNIKRPNELGGANELWQEIRSRIETWEREHR